MFSLLLEYYFCFVVLQPLIEYVLRSDEILDCDEALLFEAATRLGRLLSMPRRLLLDKLYFLIQPF